MYLSSLYGPVYLVSHIVIMYMMPELGLIIALEPSRKSGFQKRFINSAVFANNDDIQRLVIH